MLILIQNPEVLWKATDLTWKNEKARKDAAKKKFQNKGKMRGLQKNKKNEGDEKNEDVIIITNVSYLDLGLGVLKMLRLGMMLFAIRMI